MITYETTNIHSIIDYLKEKQPQHYKDMKDKSLYPEVDINWEYYLEISKLDMSVVVLAKENKEIIGYSIYILNSDLHNKNNILATNVALFIEK
jgi:hypothetical protein